MEKIAIIVVLYNKEVAESTTINTLLLKGLSNADLIIHNNGPDQITMPLELGLLFRDRQISFSLINCMENSPLSVVYNNFITEHVDFNKFVILDDDSELTDSFMSALLANDYELELPKIKSRVDNTLYYPLSHGHVVSKPCYLNVSGTHSIGSGLIFTKSLVEKFASNNLSLFDEHYALYGVDISLFRRMWFLNKKGVDFKIKTSSEILHSLSRTEGAESPFRREERVMDFAISVRQYPTFRSYLSLIKRSAKNIISLNFKELFLMYRTYFQGKHPRCK